MTELLKVTNVDAGYGDSRALTKLSLSLHSGKLLALVGANGAGKSTLLRIIAGAHRPWSGSIEFKGQEISGLSDFERARGGIALTPEGRRLFSSLSVKENLVMGASSKRGGAWNLDTVLDVLPMLRPLLGQNSSTLSGGQQQAVAIGRSLMSNPELLLLDEVSLGLAPIVVDEIYESLSEVISSGLGVILVEQDLRRTMEVADYIVCLLEGHNVLESKAGQVTREQITEAYFGSQVSSFKESDSEASRGQ